MAATVQDIIRLLSNEHGNITGEGNRDLAQKLRKYAYNKEELELIYKQVLLHQKKQEEKKKR